MKLRGLLGLIILAGLMGCITSGNRRLDDPAAVAKARDAKTKDEVVAALGEPTSQSTNDKGEEIWVYMLTKSAATPASYIPIIGLVAGGADAKSQALTFTFTQDGAVKSVSKSQSAMKVRMGQSTQDPKP